MSREITRANCLDHFLNLPGKFDGKFQLRVKRKLVSPSPTENPKSLARGILNWLFSLNAPAS